MVCCMSVVYVFTTPILEDGGDDPTVEQVKKRAKWIMTTITMGFLRGQIYMAEDASSKKFLVSNFTNYKITDSRPVMEQHNELLGRFTQRKMNMDEAIQISCIIDKLYRSWKLLLSWAVICALRSPSGRRIVTSKGKHCCWLHLMDSGAVVRLPDPKLKTLGERGIECIFVGYAEHSKAFRFYVIEPNDSVSINSIIESRDAIFDENRFSSVPRPSLRISNRTETLVVQWPEFQLYLIEGTRDAVSNQQSYCFNVEDDPKTFDEAMKFQDVAFWKEAINDEMDSIMGNNT
ncbi:hypothetical protein Tco_1063386 [Tanacetum coccineum]